jgi:hypothetical protein
VPTRFASKHLVLRDVLRSIEAVKALTVTDQWCQLRGEAVERAHDMLTARKHDLYSVGAKVEELLHSEMDAFHRLAEDQTMLLKLHGVIALCKSAFQLREVCEHVPRVRQGNCAC